MATTITNPISGTIYTYTVIKGDSPLARGSWAGNDQYVVLIYKDDMIVGFLKTLDRQYTRRFSSSSAARKAISRVKSGDFHR